MASLPVAFERYFGIFVAEHDDSGTATLVPHAAAPAAVPCPNTGRPLRVATVDGRARAICPSCAAPGAGGYVSFVGDLRLAYACPSCEQFIWLPGA